MRCRSAQNLPSRTLNIEDPIRRGGGRAASGERSAYEVYYDILRASLKLRGSGERVTKSRIGRRASVPNNRLKDRLAELRDLGLVTEDYSVTEAGQEYCREYAKHVGPFLSRYRFGRSP